MQEVEADYSVSSQHFKYLKEEDALRTRNLMRPSPARTDLSCRRGDNPPLHLFKYGSLIVNSARPYGSESSSVRHGLLYLTDGSRHCLPRRDVSQVIWHRSSCCVDGVLRSVKDQAIGLALEGMPSHSRCAAEIDPFPQNRPIPFPISLSTALSASAFPIRQGSKSCQKVHFPSSTT